MAAAELERDGPTYLRSKAAPLYETQRQALAPGLEYTSIRGLQHHGVNGEALVAFVVDTSGRADLDTFTVEKSTAPEITKAIREFLPSQRFTPATLDGRFQRHESSLRKTGHHV